ncbi:MAG: acyl-ACP--UDP-N-acetylglucosamine O-acyltransferase [Calditrichaeota bacterium]|nr:acyl-ACP--UDP-N-acetylglucosamine O-acyltransferase [Candidatus Cloacimonadota bacterium]MCA9786500.1 acyl-ACP--UDP-N-acetylglucosamine O-acyltransferase [Candidatus Cloacimonadota bacterium]MCB1045636.1 acyl-ACP--UDP-N-acetylglucosamine O-acyltransferase [Calditrichota bacterium]MCB9474618.1 acyl-ACP--UDP-N-acetylglucosamine O-acyltransferase [Candidatus Delongbacteria bacterium]
MIHPTAVIHPEARLGEGVVVEAYAIIEEDTVLGDGCWIGPRAQISAGARLGREVKVFHCASVSCVPQDLKFGGERTTLEVGDRTVIREFVTLSRGTEEAGVTRVGADCLLMAYVHVAHDCQIGDRVILANMVQVAGHVKLGYHVSVGGMVPIHQFVRVGDHAFIAGNVSVTKDVPPFVLANDTPLRFCGLNSVGLRRRGYDGDRLLAIKRHYRLIYGKGSTTPSQALSELEERAHTDEDARVMADFIRSSERGIIQG